MTDLVPYSFSSLPIFRNFWDDEDSWLTPSSSSGLSISEDDKSIFVEAALPGIDPKKIEVTFDKGVVWIKGEADVEEKDGKKFYKRAASSFSYRVVVPGEIDQNSEATATYKNGVMTVTFAKLPQSQPKKIAVNVD
jgi:HSP20 family protein